MLAAASIKVMDALFGLVAQNDAETYTSFIFIVTKLERDGDWMLGVRDVYPPPAPPWAPRVSRGAKGGP